MENVVVVNTAFVNVTYNGYNGNLEGAVNYDASSDDIKNWVKEALRTGTVPGIPVQAEVDLTDFTIDKFAADGKLPARIFCRPKATFG